MTTEQRVIFSLTANVRDDRFYVHPSPLLDNAQAPHSHVGKLVKMETAKGGWGG
jgi:hypothetical protein